MVRQYKRLTQEWRKKDSQEWRKKGSQGFGSGKSCLTWVMGIKYAHMLQLGLDVVTEER